MATEQATFQPVFDPENPGASLETIKAMIPVNAKWVRGTVIGEIASRKTGDGFEYDSLDDYDPDEDDARDIDWSVTASEPNGKPQAWKYHEAVTPNLIVVTDMLQSRNNVGYPGHFSEQHLAMSAVLGLMRMGQSQHMPTAMVASDNYGLATQKIKPMDGKRSVRRAALQMADVIARNEKPADVSYRLDDLLGHVAHKVTDSVVAIVSDFRDAEAASWADSLAALGKKNSVVVAVETTNPTDYELLATRDRYLLNGQGYVLADGKEGDKQRREAAANANDWQQAIDGAVPDAKARHIKLSTTDAQWMDSFRNQLRK